jgi:putative two-component system response regulator
MRILAVEDNQLEADILRNALHAMGHETAAAYNGRDALDFLRTGTYQIVISDWEMPGMSGLDLCREIRRRQLGSYTYVILLTCRTGTPHVVAGMDAGADDYISKPFHPRELESRIRAAERLLALESRDLTIFALAKLAEVRDPETGWHLERMREYCRVLAEELARCPKYEAVVDGNYVQMLYLTSPLHDIGKVGIEDRILLKKGRLTPDEFDAMKMHTVLGGQALDSVARHYPDAYYLRTACDIALTHHEKYDGSGYPNGLAGDEIPLSGRIVALADVYDALTSKRVYKPAYSHETAKATILDGRGSHFDPDVVDAFLSREGDFREIHHSFADTAAPVVPCAMPYSRPGRVRCGSPLTTA